MRKVCHFLEAGPYPDLTVRNFMNGGALMFLADFSIATTAKLNQSESPILGYLGNAGLKIISVAQHFGLWIMQWGWFVLVAALRSSSWLSAFFPTSRGRDFLIFYFHSSRLRPQGRLGRVQATGCLARVLDYTGIVSVSIGSQHAGR